MPLKIINLVAENIKRLTAVDITPNELLVQITGRNGQGKTSVLDAIWWALEGTRHIQIEPIHAGASKGRIRIDMGELIVERTFKRATKGKDSYTTGISVTTADGKAFSSPQTVLDGLLGELTFDPLQFARSAPKAQLEALKALIPGVDFDGIAEAREADFARRTEVGRVQRQEQAAADAIILPPDLPQEEVNEDTILDEIEEAADLNSGIERRRMQLRHAEQERAKIENEIRNSTAVLEEVNKTAEQLRTELEGMKPVDIEALRARHNELRKLNDLILARKRRDQHQSQADHAGAEYEALSRSIEQRDEAKRRAIEGAALPVTGLALGENEVLFNGMPFSQAADSEQLRISVAIAMAMNPNLHVIRVRDGSLLDDVSMELLAQLAVENDFQIWCERVETSGKIGFVIEDGKLASG